MPNIETYMERDFKELIDIIVYDYKMTKYDNIPRLFTFKTKFPLSRSSTYLQKASASYINNSIGLIRQFIKIINQ